MREWHLMFWRRRYLTAETSSSLPSSVLIMKLPVGQTSFASLILLSPALSPQQEAQAAPTPQQLHPSHTTFFPHLMLVLVQPVLPSSFFKMWHFPMNVSLAHNKLCRSLVNSTTIFLAQVYVVIIIIILL